MTSWCLLLALAACATAAPIDLADEFATWASLHAKEYGSQQERSERYAVWTTNREFVNNHNARADQGLSTFRMKLNHMGDLSHDDYRTTMLGYQLSSRPQRAAPVHVTGPQAAPDTWDWRPLGVVGAVKVPPVV